MENITFTPDFNQQLIISGLLFVIIALFFKYSGFFGGYYSKKSKKQYYFYKISWYNTVQEAEEERHLIMSEPMTIDIPVIIKKKILKGRVNGIIEKFEIKQIVLINKDLYKLETNETLRQNEHDFF